jgi:uncharacterized protein (TIGR03118 family)
MSAKIRLTMMAFVFAGMLAWCAIPAAAQYRKVNLVSNVAGYARFTDPNLANAWGLAFFPDGAFWVSDNDTGLSTVYSHSGKPSPLVVTIPTASGTGTGTPTGMVANSTSQFVISKNGKSAPAQFLFDTDDGTISGWSPEVDATNAVIAVNNSSSLANYEGLAIASTAAGNFIYAADGVNNRVDMFDGDFNLVKSFTAPNNNTPYTAYNVQNIDGRLYVAFANATVTGGFVDIFDTDGNYLKTFASGGVLDGPWGMALAPSNFGKFSNALLIGNVDFAGNINAFDSTTGAFLGTLEDAQGKPISISYIWALAFGDGSSANGATNQLFFTGGPDFYLQGVFGVIVATQ